MAFNPIDVWNMTLTPDDLLGAKISFFFKVKTYDASTNVITGALCNERGTVESSTILLRNGKFRPNSEVANTFHMNFEIDLGGLVIHLGGIAKERAAGSDKLRFDGTYFRFQETSVSAAAGTLAEPGDTGTGGGQQTGT